MSKFCSQCGAMMDDAQMFCGGCGAPASAPQQAPQYGAPQYDAPQQAPQYGAPQYGAPQQAPQYGAPQYGAPQQVPQYNAAPNAFTQFFSNMDWMGMLTGKAPMFQNCLAALAVQFLSFIFFFLPMLTVKVRFFGYSEKARLNIFTSSSGAGVVIPVFALLILLGSIAFLVLPLFSKKEIQPLNVLVFFAGQTVYFLMVVITIIVRVVAAGIGLGNYSSVASCGISAGFIFFVLFTLAAMFVSGRILFFHKDEVFAIFKKPAGSAANNNVPTGYPTGNFQNNGYANNNYTGANQPQDNNFPNNNNMN